VLDGIGHGSAGASVPEANPPSFIVNGQRRPWRSGITLEEVVTDGIEFLGASTTSEQETCARPVDVSTTTAGVERTCWATSLNARFVPRGQRRQTLITPGDVVLVFQPIVGG
jgi:sulfur carrier protein ThiS